MSAIVVPEPMDHRLVEGMVPKVGLGYMDDGKKKGKKGKKKKRRNKSPNKKWIYNFYNNSKKFF